MIIRADNGTVGVEEEDEGRSTHDENPVLHGKTL